MKTSPLRTASPVKGAPVASRAFAPETPRGDRFEKSSDEGRGVSWRGLALGGLALASAMGAAGCSQAEVRTTSQVGDVKGLLLPKGHVDAEGHVTDPLGLRVMNVRPDGTITGTLNIGIKGWVNDKGSFTQFGHLFPSGRVDAGGDVYNAWGARVGHVEGQDPNRIEDVEKGGAALLLFQDEN